MNTPPAVTVAQVIAELAARAAVEHPELASRLEKAVAIASDPYSIYGTGNGGSYVRSQCAPGTVYTVRGSQCDCPDHRQRGRLCKHSLAVGLLKAASRIRDDRQRAADYGTRYTLTAQGEAALLAAAI